MIRMVNLKPIQIYTDGACRGNPGKGGWGCVINDNGVESEMRGYLPQTTNNRMELIAVIEVLKSISQERELIIFTDSKYVMDGITVWINNWKNNDWLTAGRKKVKNKDLWVELDQLISARMINWEWVKGHAGNAGNERADFLANLAIDENSTSNKVSEKK